MTTFHGRPLCLAPGVASTLNLPFEGSAVINRDQPAGVAFHMLDDDGRLITHYRTIPAPENSRGDARREDSPLALTREVSRRLAGFWVPPGYGGSHVRARSHTPDSVAITVGLVRYIRR